MESEAEKKAQEIIKMLLGRKGFEYWWEPNAGGITEESQREIFSKIVRIIES